MLINQLLSNLPFNPSLIDEVEPYRQKLQREVSLRRTGVAFLVATLCVQIYAAISPPQQSLTDKKSSPVVSSCSNSQTNQDCPKLTLVAVNSSQNVKDASQTSAKPGDEIAFRLFATNTSTTSAISYKPTINISDLLEYTDIESINEGKLQEETVAWQQLTIEPQATQEHNFSLLVKDPLPKTNSPHNNQNAYDMRLAVTYGNTVNINLQPNIPKTAEQLATELPNTSATTGVVICLSLALFAAYFCLRSRLIKKEVDIVCSEYGSGGIT